MPSSSASLVLLPRRLFCQRSGILPLRLLLLYSSCTASFLHPSSASSPFSFLVPVGLCFCPSRSGPRSRQDSALPLQVSGCELPFSTRLEPSGHFSRGVQVPRGGRALTSEYGRSRAGPRSLSRDLANCLFGDFSPFQVAFFVRLRGSSCARATFSAGPRARSLVLLGRASLTIGARPHRTRHLPFARPSPSGRALLFLPPLISLSSVPSSVPLSLPWVGGCPGR